MVAFSLDPLDKTILPINQPTYTLAASRYRKICARTIKQSNPYNKGLLKKNWLFRLRSDQSVALLVKHTKADQRLVAPLYDYGRTMGLPRL